MSLLNNASDLMVDFEEAAWRAGIDTISPATTPLKAASPGPGPGQNGTKRDTAPRFTMIQDFCALQPQQSWIVRRYLEPDTICTWFGDSGAFKSFLAMDLICHVATGRPWRGNKTKQGFCLYIAGEGGNGLSKRFRAWFKHHNEALRNIGVSTVPLAMCEPSSVDELIRDIMRLVKSPGVMPLVIVLDTLSTHFGPGDESKTSEMRMFMQGIRRLRMETSAAIIIPHHVGHGNKERERGSISLAQDVDWRYRVERQSGTNITTLTNVKARDSEHPAALSWNLEVVRLPWAEEDEDGGSVPMTSLVPIPVETAEAQPKPEYLPKAQRVALDALRTALVNHGTETSGVVAVAEDQWREAAYIAKVSDSNKPDTRKKAFNRCRNELVAAGKVSSHEGRFWIPKPTRTKRDKTGHCPEMSPGCREGQGDITGHIPLGMSRCVPCPDNPTWENGGQDGKETHA